MARKTRRRAAQRNQRAVDILNRVAGNEEDGDETRETDIRQHIDAESVDHDHGDDQRQTRQTRRSARLNKRTARDVTPAPINNIPGRPDSPMFFPYHEPESEAEDAADEEFNEAEEADEAEDEDEREVDEDGDSVESEEDTSMSDSERQLRQEQEQSIANSQREQQELEQALLTSPVSVVIYSGKERVREEQKEDATTTKAAEPETVRAKANHNDFLGEDGEFEDSESEQEDEESESQQENEKDKELASDSFDMNDSRHDVGTALQSLFDWDIRRSVRSDDPDEPAEVTEHTEPVQRPRIDDRLETHTPQTSGPSSRKRRRASNDSPDMPDRTRRRREPQNQNKIPARRNTPFALPTNLEAPTSPRMSARTRQRRESQNRNEIATRRRTPTALPADLEVATSPEMPYRTRRHRESPNQNIERAPSRRPPAARGLPEVADWEATILEEETRNEVIVVGKRITYDDATKIQDLQGTWERLIKYCQKLKKVEVRRMRRYPGIEAVVERISDLLQDYKRMQRKRVRGRAIDADTWKRTRQEVKYISEDAEKIRKVIVRRAKEGKESNDLQAQADAAEYAELIVQQVMTSLCELALECLKTYYSEEDEWLLYGGFGAVLDIIDIVGELDTVLTSLHKCAMVVLSPYPGLPIRQELRSIRGSLKDSEAVEQRRRR